MFARSAFGLLLAAVVGASVCAVWFRFALEPRLARLELSAPVLVLDRAGAIRRLPAGAPPEVVGQTLRRLQEQAGRLAASGYLVIDAGMVLAAPVDLYVRDAP